MTALFEPVQTKQNLILYREEKNIDVNDVKDKYAHERPLMQDLNVLNIC